MLLADMGVTPEKAGRPTERVRKVIVEVLAGGLPLRGEAALRESRSSG